MSGERKTNEGTATIAANGRVDRNVRALPGGIRLTVTERCELGDWKDACVADDVERALAVERQHLADRVRAEAQHWKAEGQTDTRDFEICALLIERSNV